MTMHMIQGVSSLNTKSHKIKPTKKDLENWKRGHAQYNKSFSKDCRVSLEDYINIVHGKIPEPYRASGESIKDYVFTPSPPRPCSTNNIPSYSGNEYSCSKVESQKYTGTLVKGISQTHKSNAVPVINEQEMIDHARMRR